MSNQYLQQLNILTSASGQYLLPMTDDPAGTSRLKKITVNTLFTNPTFPSGFIIAGDYIKYETLTSGSVSVGGGPASDFGTNAPFIYIDASGTSEPTWHTSGTLIGGNTSSIYVGNIMDFRKNGGGPLFIVDYTGRASGSFIGNGSGLYGLTYSQISDLANFTTQGNTFNGNSQLVQLTAAGKYPALDGSLITNIAGGGGGSSSGLVISVAGRSGAVVLTTADIGGLGQVALYNSGTIFLNTPLSGVPTAPTAANGTNTTQLATTQFVTTAVTNASGGVKSVAGRTGIITLSNTDITGLGTAATQNTGTAGANLPFLNGINTWSAQQTFTAPISGTLISGVTIAGGNGYLNTLTVANQISGATFFGNGDGLTGVTAGAPSLGAFTIYANSTNSTASASGIQTLVLGTPGFVMPAGTLGGQVTGANTQYYQFSLQNTSAASGASTDLVITANNGNDNLWYLNLGINNSSGGTAPFTASGAAYLYASDSNELNIGCHGASGIINFYVNSGILKAGWFDTSQNLNLIKNLNITGNTYFTGTASGSLISGNTIAGGNGYLNTLTVANQISGATFFGNGAGLTSVSATIPDSLITNNITLSGKCGASQSALMISGTPSIGGTATTNWPMVYINASGAVAPTTWNAAGTLFGINGHAGFAGNMIDIHANGGVTVFNVNNAGNLACGNISCGTLGATTPTFTGKVSTSFAATASNAAMTITGLVFSGGTGTTSFPQYLAQAATNTTAATTWNPSGTFFGVNAPNNFFGNFVDYRRNGGASVFNINSSGSVVANTITLSNALTNSSILKANSSGVVVPAVAGTDYVLPFSTTQYSGQQYIAPQPLISGITVQWNMNTAPNAKLSISNGFFTLANPTNIVAGGQGTLTIIQPPTGTSGSILWGSAYKFPAGIKAQLSTANNARDHFDWYSYDGTNVDVTTRGLNFS